VKSLARSFFTSLGRSGKIKSSENEKLWFARKSFSPEAADASRSKIESVSRKRRMSAEELVNTVF
jgi:hypothetical protein